MVRLDADTPVPADAPMAFDLSSSIVTHPGSSDRSRERPIGGATTGLIGLGEVVRWRTRQQRKDPFDSFRHEHLFEPAEHGTRPIDVRDTFLVSEASRLGATMGPGTDG